MAKFILTESQYYFLLEEEKVARFLLDTINESKNIENLKAKIKKLMLAGVAVSSILFAINQLALSDSVKKELENIVKSEQVTDSLFQQKVNACENYMKMALGNQGLTMADTKLSPEKLVKACEENSFDLAFLLAAAHQESCFGAVGKAKRTNSVFNEGAYDDGRTMATYESPNDSVDGYLSLLKSRYLLGGKTIHDLLKPGGFVNDLGMRYAKDPNYEKKLKRIRGRIITMFPELS